MLDLLDASPSVGAWRCEPMSIAEIDAHPDRDRIWATIKAMQNVSEDERQRVFDQMEDDFESARSEEHAGIWRECKDRISSAIKIIGDGISADDAEYLIKVLE